LSSGRDFTWLGESVRSRAYCRDLWPLDWSVWPTLPDWPMPSSPSSSTTGDQVSQWPVRCYWA